MKIGSRVYVTFLSRSKIAGEAGTVIGSSARDGYKVRTDFGVVGYAKAGHVCELVDSDSPTSMSLPKIDEGVVDPTDLLTRAVVFEDFSGTCIGGFVSDQWIEEGVELLNIVHDGKFTVIPRSLVICTMKPVPHTNPKTYTVDSYI